MRRRARSAWRGVAGLAFALPLACREPSPTAGTAASAQAPAISPANAAIVQDCRRAEYARDGSRIPASAATNHSPEVRRAAAIAAARVADEGAVQNLRRSLADEDPDVVAWSAYGLGVACAGHEVETVRALSLRAASYMWEEPPRKDERRLGIGAFDAIADSLSRCGTEPAEATLRACLELPGERAESAAHALGRLAARRRGLEDRTTVALLDAAARPVPVHGALDAFARFSVTSEGAKKRLLEIASRTAKTAGSARTEAIRALFGAGEAAARVLEELAADEQVSSADRAVAASVLGRLGPGAQPALAQALVRSLSANPDDAWLTTRSGFVETVLSALEPPAETAVDALAKLAAWPVKNENDAPSRRRIVAARCGAASILAGSASLSARLAACDLGQHGRPWALGVLRVLDRAPLEGARLDNYRALARDADPAVRRAALGVFARHPEIWSETEILVNGLTAGEPGVVAEAAHAITDDPRMLAGVSGKDSPREPSPPNPAVLDALGRALDQNRPEDEVDTRVALLAAAAQSSALSLKSRVEKACKSPNVTVRNAATAALRALGGAGAACPPATAAQFDPPPARGPVTLTFVTDAGRFGLTLDPSLAPLSVDRVVDLARHGFYDGVAIHRVLPGAIVQFGDRGGDGYGGAGRAPLPSETSPTEFGAFAVGLAQAGRDTGSSQIFVTLSPQPQLYGDYPALGWADPEWALAHEGDLIRKVEIRE